MVPLLRTAAKFDFMARLLKSFKWAGQGIIYCIRREKNFQLHCFFAGLAILAGILFSISAIEWIVLTMCMATVLTLEMLNTAIEHLCNITRPEKDPTVKIIKDVSAGAVLVIAIMTVVCGAIIFIPKIVASL